jgi:hypothetical protein
MKNTLELYNEILFLNLRPWVYGSHSEMKFKQLLLDEKKEYYTGQPLYKVEFVQPLTNIRKYYKTIIELEAIRFLNSLHEEIQLAQNKYEKQYIVHVTLTKALSQKLTETAQVISERSYSTSQYDFSNPGITGDKAIGNESYVLHYLKSQLIRLYLEVQDLFPEYSKESMLSVDEIYYKYFDEQAPKESNIVKSENTSITNHLQNIESEEKTVFNPIKGDFKILKKGINSYSQLVKNPSRFAFVEEKLFEKGLIKDYIFIDTYRNKKYLAAFYHQLIRKGYFNTRIFPGNIEIKSLQVRKFLDYRYNANVDKQFRLWENDEKALLEYIEKDYWLDIIPAC